MCRAGFFSSGGVIAQLVRPSRRLLRLTDPDKGEVEALRHRSALWTPDRGPGFYQTQRARNAAPHLVTTGRCARQLATRLNPFRTGRRPCEDARLPPSLGASTVARAPARTDHLLYLQREAHWQQLAAQQAADGAAKAWWRGGGAEGRWDAREGSGQFAAFISTTGSVTCDFVMYTRGLVGAAQACGAVACAVRRH